MDLAAYREETEAFLAEITREHYLHFSGRQGAYDIEPIYERHARLFSREAVEELRVAGERALLEFAVEGLVGRETKAEAAELARREAALEVAVNGSRMPFRAAAVAQAREPDPERREALQSARDALTVEELNPLLRKSLERSHALARELGFANIRELCEELSGIDLSALGRQAQELLDATEATYEPTVSPQLEQQLGFGLDRLRRSDLPAFFRAPELDSGFPADRLVPSLAETLAALGIDLRVQSQVVIDAEERPTKSPRAFCAPVLVPDEVYLVITPAGGREDYAALYHEAGHAEHFAHVDAALPVEQRLLGDNSVTECFAFLLEHLVADPAWLRRRLGGADAQQVAAHAHATKLVFLRRYCAKLDYELALHGAMAPLASMPARYADGLSRAVRVDWPRASWLSDVDPFFYAARYLRAWALEARVRALLRGRFGEAWFEEPAAGELLRGLWRRGQRQSGGELLAELTGEEISLSALEAELGAPGA